MSKSENSKLVNKIRKKSFCFKCGSKNNLEFHHLKTSKKVETISRLAHTGSKIKLLTELKKCIMLCTNCHTEYHRNESLIYNEKEKFYLDIFREKQNE